ncbi:hypothetical protein VTN00DRAFT_6814 [Thermoascus crustaceus]|uniref:uncharacterized protein n=1 Tax=Thermoascus crustaceus TaxID=5088 RepID=UPI0037436767
MADRGDRMYCHACNGLWLRNDHGLICPYCESDFTEIIEVPPDTPAEQAFSPLRQRPSPSRRERSRSPTSPFAGHNPWRDITDHYPFRDREETESHEFGDGGEFTRRQYRSPDGRFTFTSTTFSSGGRTPRMRSPQDGGFPDHPLLPMLQNFDSIFRGLMDPMDHEHRDTRRTDREPSWGPESGERGPGGNDAFTASGRLWPRDADHPQPMAHPLGSINDILELFRTDLGPEGMGGPGRRGGVRVMTGPNPLSILASLLNMDRHGDAVYSQEELDRVISQLINQNQNGNAPPPASQSAIHSLPRKKIDREMLGPEGKAECSICMDSVQLGTEVTVLPCKHWFHFNCIEMWLNQHNTCPHCRRGINTPGQVDAEGSRNNPVVISSSPPEPSSPQHRSPTNSNHNNGSPQSGYQSSSHSRASYSTDHERRRSGRSDGHGGGITGWVRSHFGGAS